MHILIGLLMLALGAMQARAQGVADHLQCFKVTNANLKRLKGVVDLDAPSIGLAPGCRLSRAKLYCTPSKATVQPGTLFDGQMPVAGLPYNGRPAETDRICYKVACERPIGTAPDQTVTDRFGTHELTRLTTEMLCTPATGGTLPPPASGFQIKTPEVDIQPGQDVTYCYYFRTPNTVTVPVKRWVSEMGPVNHQIVMFTTTTMQGVPIDRLPPGTVSAANCNAFSTDFQDVPHWVYEASSPSAQLELPADDGAGNPVAIEIPPYSAGFLMMHHINRTADVIKSRVTLNAEALDGVVYTKSATFATYDSTISIPPQTNNYVVSRSCDLPPGAQFWRMTTLAHKQAVRTAVLDGPNVVFESMDWANPGAQTWPTPPFFTFASDQLTYACTYNNPTNRTIRTGDSYQTDERCMAVGYFFPATTPKWCYNGFPLF